MRNHHYLTSRDVASFRCKNTTDSFWGLMQCTDAAPYRRNSQVSRNRWFVLLAGDVEFGEATVVDWSVAEGSEREEAEFPAERGVAGGGAQGGPQPPRVARAVVCPRKPNETGKRDIFFLVCVFCLYVCVR